MNILIINGPNLNLLGKREREHYGKMTPETLLGAVREAFPGVSIDLFQSNVEGELINKLHEGDGKYDGIILNAGGYTHTSVAIGDAVAAIPTPVVEVHVSNICGREPYRHVSHIAPHAAGVITGFGTGSYFLAVEALTSKRVKYFLPNKK